ncbi:MAG: AAA family ATPase [Acidimicrobiia bacterium]|nr:AAA family ATPase [Acidimicrobiia bacterium]
MIIFKSIKYKNFLSSGNYFTEIPLDKHKSTLIVGHNGAGKSTILDAISFALFGKPHRKISKSQLVNSINQKQAVVEVEFIIGKAQFKIVRGIKPNIFEIWKDGSMINQSSHSLEYQKILEQNILKLNHKSFHQVVVLGSSSFIPFMQLNAGHRRNVIEDLLDINIFSKMNIILRERNSILKENINKINNDTNIVKSKIEQQTKYIRDIAAVTQENRSKYEEQIKKAQEKINILQNQNSELSEELESNTASDELKKLQIEKNKIISDVATIKQEMKTIAKRGMFLEKNDECPTCEQTIQNKDKLISDTKNEAYQVQSSLNMVESNGTIIDNNIVSLETVIAKIREKTDTINANNREIVSLNQSNQDLQKYLESEVAADLTGAKKDLEKMNSDKESLFEEKLKLNEQFGYNGVIGEMLRDTGIKTKIIKQYLPVINKLVNQYLQTLDFFVHFNLDENFNETIRSRHRDDFTYDSFSEGEKQRIDLSLLFTWRQIAKMKNSVATNLLVLDETFDSSLDHDGIENLLKILYTLDEGSNTFIISHKGDILDGKFESKIEFFKDRNFSKIKN